MSILKSTNSGKTFYWFDIVKKKGYVYNSTMGSVFERKTLYWNCYTYPHVSNVDASVVLTEDKELITYIVYGNKTLRIHIQDQKQLETCEWYWEAKYNKIFGDKSEEKAIELAKEILQNEYPEIFTT